MNDWTRRIEQRLEGGGDEWLADWRFDTNDQQSWWDELTPDQRAAFAMCTWEDEPTTPGDAAVRARALEYQDRRTLLVPGWVFGLVWLVLVALGVTAPFEPQIAGIGASMASLGVIMLVLHRGQRRQRWARIERYRALARTGAEVLDPVGQG